ncbi:phage tail protein [Frankia sp. QA3]|uniref:phage tail protein n=1 Tax=Frankia sp. QA3 TaxID=710111 RepID=UPI000269C002|nr:phage tail protein [Frankia sp. QA3]EIV92964.1 putative phage tail region protein [Frankia sp. QA3]
MAGLVNSLRFDVTIGQFDLGAFTAIEGLDASYEIKTYDEGGQNGFQHQLLGRVHYQNVKLTRPVDQDSRKLTSWFSAFRREGDGAPTTATITAFDDNRARVAEWSMVGVCPVRYSGPRFSASDGKIATETLEFAHQGFAVSWG